MEGANIDYSYNEYENQIENDNLINIECDGLVYRFNVDEPDNACYEVIASEIYEVSYDSKNEIEMEEQETIEVNEKDKSEIEELDIYFNQRPDEKNLYEETKEKLDNIAVEYNYVIDTLSRVESYIEYSTNPNLIEKYNELKEEKEHLEPLVTSLKNKITTIETNAYNYKNNQNGLKQVDIDIKNIKKKYPNINFNNLYNEIMEKKKTSDSIDFYYTLEPYEQEYLLMLDKKGIYEDEIKKIISNSITIDDIKDSFEGYDSSIGVVPAGKIDTWTNNQYYEDGYITGLAGSFEGPQGKETGYDSRKGDSKTNYKDPDRALLELLSQVTDENGNILYPMESFEKGGKYYYHIFGVNDDGTINQELIDNPRFGFKMLGDYFLVGVGPNSYDENCYNRQRGSIVITSLGKAIVADYGSKSDDPLDWGHIDFNMDEVLFWLKNYSHNKDRVIESISGIYDWCTTEEYNGKIDVDYEFIERNYVNNINATYNKNYKCIFDRGDFENETTYKSQEEFVYKLTH